jgi:hypothetical protein
VSAARYVLVWDLDRTLGLFDSLDRAQHSTNVTVMLRPGIALALEALSRAGFVHTVLTLATPIYAQLALHGTGLHHRFEEVAGAGQRPKGDVAGIAKRFGIPEAQRGERMLFIGDHPLFDAPTDRSVVFHLELRALWRDAAKLTDLVLALRDEGKGSLREGYDRLLERSSGAPLRRVAHDRAGPLILLPRQDECPVVVFDDGDEPTPNPRGTPITFDPRDVAARLQSPPS